MTAEQKSPDENRVGVLMGEWLITLARMGATDRELRHLARRWNKASLTDLARIEVACYDRMYGWNHRDDDAE